MYSKIFCTACPIIALENLYIFFFRNKSYLKENLKEMVKNMSNTKHFTYLHGLIAFH